MLVEVLLFAAGRWEAANLNIDALLLRTVLVAQILLLLSEILDLLTHLANAFDTFLAKVGCIMGRCSPLLSLIDRRRGTTNAGS